MFMFFLLGLLYPGQWSPDQRSFKRTKNTKNSCLSLGEMPHLGLPYPIGERTSIDVFPRGWDKWGWVYGQIASLRLSIHCAGVKTIFRKCTKMPFFSARGDFNGIECVCDTTEGPHMNQSEEGTFSPPRRHHQHKNSVGRESLALPRTLTSRLRLGHVCLPTYWLLL